MSLSRTLSRSISRHISYQFTGAPVSDFTASAVPNTISLSGVRQFTPNNDTGDIWIRWHVPGDADAATSSNSILVPSEASGTVLLVPTGATAASVISRSGSSVPMAYTTSTTEDYIGGDNKQFAWPDGNHNDGLYYTFSAALTPPFGFCGLFKTGTADGDIEVMAGLHNSSYGDLCEIRHNNTNDIRQLTKGVGITTGADIMVAATAPADTWYYFAATWVSGTERYARDGSDKVSSIGDLSGVPSVDRFFIAQASNTAYDAEETCAWAAVVQSGSGDPISDGEWTDILAGKNPAKTLSNAIGVWPMNGDTEADALYDVMGFKDLLKYGGSPTFAAMDGTQTYERPNALYTTTTGPEVQNFVLAIGVPDDDNAFAMENHGYVWVTADIPIRINFGVTSAPSTIGTSSMDTPSEQFVPANTPTVVRCGMLSDVVSVREVNATNDADGSTGGTVNIVSVQRNQNITYEFRGAEVNY
ncbi:MAG: hypothetical protein OEQ74_03340 [Gammaproteobacteria bacterium]|nr:hypothetical protein [Gammaproteobacteria bacterium]